MEENILYKRMAKYKEYLNKLGEYSLSYSPSIKELNLSKGAIRSCYKEIEEEGIKGSLLDYLCWLSTEWISFRWGEDLKAYDGFNDKLVSFYNNVPDKDLTKKDHLNKSGHFSFLLAISSLLGIIFINLNNAKNCVRLFDKDMNYFINTGGYKFYKANFSFKIKTIILNEMLKTLGDKPDKKFIEIINSLKHIEFIFSCFNYVREADYVLNSLGGEKEDAQFIKINEIIKNKAFVDLSHKLGRYVGFYNTKPVKVKSSPFPPE